MKTKTKIIPPTEAEDARINAGIASDSDSPELTAEEFARGKPAREFFDAQTLAGLTELKRKPGERGAQKAPTKERITIRLSPEVLEQFRATGTGWQTRVDAALNDWLKSHSPSSIK